MEKKTIGRFIAALRKANGMTQRELAERLNISDKSVSRWECDESYPDLSLIPVLAEIFGVSCDELLRGERISPEARSENDSSVRSEAEVSRKAEKQLGHILSSAMLQYKTASFIAIGISAVGLTAALICNLAFNRAVLGFFLGVFFFTAAIVCQCIFLSRALFKVGDTEFSVLPELDSYKRIVIRLAELSFGITLILLGFTLPLAATEAYVGLGTQSMLSFGIPSATVCTVIYITALWFVNARLIDRGVYRLSEKDERIYRRNHRLKLICAIALTALFIVTAIIQEITTSVDFIMNGTVFEDYDSFVSFMEQDVPSPADYAPSFSSAPFVVEPNTGSDESSDENSAEYDHHEVLRDRDGNILCEYNRRNESVCRIEYEGSNTLPITVYTLDELNAARLKAVALTSVFKIIYLFEIIVTLTVYFLRRTR